MGIFGFGKRAVAAEMVGRNVTGLMIDADQCWADVCALRSYKPDGTIATCEMAFARAALTKFILIEDQHPGVAERIAQAADSLVMESFTGEDTDITRRFYGETLDKVAPKRVALYFDNAFPAGQLAALLGVQLRVSGAPSIEAAFLFEAVERRVRGLLSKIRIV